MMSKKYTISDIAKLVGVSKGTVDRVIHNRGKVSKDALEKVSKILEEINYQPNLIARNLKKNKTYRICVIFPDPKIDNYWSTCIEGVQAVVSELKAFGIQIESYLFDPKNAFSYGQANQSVLNTAPDAVLIAPLFKKQSVKAIEAYNSKGIIVATFNNRIKSNAIPCFIGQNLHQSGRVGAKLLHQTIGQKGDLAIIHVDEKYKQALYIQEKEKGFRAYFEELAEYKPKLMTLKLKRSHFEDQIIDFLQLHTNVTGIFVTTSKAYDIIPIIKKFSPRKIVVVGYDLVPENIGYLKEGAIDFLIHQNPKQQVYLGLKTLAEHLLFDHKIKEQILLPIDIINAENVLMTPTERQFS